jgi:tetratricopeptide (TPR) repeat protein
MFSKILNKLGVRSDAPVNEQLDAYNKADRELKDQLIETFLSEDFRSIAGADEGQLALQLWLGGKRELALTAYDAAIQKNPGESSLLLNRANLKFELGRYQEAVCDYELAMQATPSLPAELFVNYEMIQKLGIDSPVLKILSEKNSNRQSNP